MPNLCVRCFNEKTKLNTDQTYIYTYTGHIQSSRHTYINIRIKHTNPNAEHLGEFVFINSNCNRNQVDVTEQCLFSL